MNKRLMVIPVALVIIFTIVVLGGCKSVNYRQEFCYETVSVHLVPKARDEMLNLGRVFNIYDFPEVELAQIRNVHVWEFIDTVALILELKHTGRQNALQAVELLRGNQYVEWVGVVSIDWIA